MAARGECTCGPSSNERLTQMPLRRRARWTRGLAAARSDGYAEGRAAERADMLAFVEEACRLGTQGDALLRALMAKGKHEGLAAISRDDGYPAMSAELRERRAREEEMAAELRALREVAEAAVAYRACREGMQPQGGQHTIQLRETRIALDAALARVPR